MERANGMTNREMLDDLLFRIYNETIAIMEDEGTSHIEAREILQFSVAAFGHAIDADFHVGTENRPGVRRFINDGMKALIEDVFIRTYKETMAIVNDERTSHEKAQKILVESLNVMTYAARN